MGSLVVTVSDGLRVRSQPRVADDSAKYEPLLPLGTELLVLGGPVTASGYAWYDVSPTSLTLADGIQDGWVAMADHDGTPWIALREGAITGFELAQSSVARAPSTAADAARAAAAINAFGIDLYKRVTSGSAAGLDAKSVVISPASIAIALAMARAGAQGETARQMDALLHVNGWDELGSGLNALDQVLASRDGSWSDPEGAYHELALKIADSAFAQRDWAIEQSFLDAIGSDLGAGIRLVDFIADPEAARSAINAWVARQTAKRIPELIRPDLISEATRLVLVNAIYLKANWELEFNKSETKAVPFSRPDGSSVTVPTMTLHGGQRVPYVSGAGWRATELRYLGADGSTPLAMTLVLPDDLATFEAGLSESQLEQVTSALDRERDHLREVTYASPASDGDCGTYPYSLTLSMPRFGIETGPLDVTPALEALGMVDAFSSETADFSGITTADRLNISFVIHQANIDVDETGTEAAAATAVGIDVGGCTGPLPAKEVSLRLDRPFMFVLHDVETGAILFMGQVVDPSTRG